SADLFAAILEAMTALRPSVPPPDDAREAECEAQREAWMRQTIRAAQRDGFQRIAVVCGAWHAPALAAGAHAVGGPSAKEEAATLAALRGRPLPGLPELNEATRTVLLFGDDLPMRLIHEKLIVGETLGRVPDETPMVPLQQDLIREQRRLRLPAEATERALD